jgi:PAS domain S-box-containing protein
MGILEDVKQFRENLRDSGEFAQLYEYLPDVIFFVKDLNSRIMMCNSTFLRFQGAKKMESILGKNSYDFFPKVIAENFIADDKRVIESEEPLIDRVELTIDEGVITWFSTTKVPLYGKSGKVIGVAGISRNLRKADRSLSPFQKMMPVIEFIKESHTKEISIAELAEMSFLSESQFRRRFKQLFRLSPLQFILKIRIESACHLLRTSSLNVSEIADRCGFEDQNYLARQFRQHMGISPTQYRKHEY